MIKSTNMMEEISTMIKKASLNKKIIKKKLLYSILLLILVLDLLTVYAHIFEQDRDDQHLKQIEALTKIKMTNTKYKSISQPQPSSFSQSKISDKEIVKYYHNQYYVTSKQIEQAQKNLQFYDFLSLVQIFKPDKTPQIVFQPVKLVGYKFSKNPFSIESEIQAINTFRKMIEYQREQQKQLDLKKTLDENETIKFYSKLYNEPTNNKYLQVEYQRYQKIYNIGQFEIQLPICVILVGNNHEKTIQQTYRSIHQQNYTNYKFIHVDDNSKDETINSALQFLEKNEDFKDFITIIRQKYQRNKLFNFNFAITKYCKPTDIVLEMNENQFLVGNQIFKLINSLYHSKNIWTLYTGSIKLIENQNLISSKSYQKFFNEQIKNSKIQTSLRVPRLRTYLKKVYDKIDQIDFIDIEMVRQEQFYTTGYQFFIYQRILQMSKYKHILILEQMPYLYSYQPIQFYDIEYSYSQLSSQMLPSYLPPKNIDKRPIRLNQSQNIALIQQKYNSCKQKIKQKRISLTKQINQLYKKSLEDNFIDRDSQYLNFIQQKIRFKQENRNKQIGKISGLIINPQTFQRNQIDFKFKDYGLDHDIQVSTKYGFINLNEINFKVVEKKIFQEVSYELLTFKYDAGLDKKPQNLKYQHFQSEQEIMAFLEQARYFTHKQQYVKDDEYFIASLLSLPTISQQAKQLEYYFFNKKYNIQNNFEENPICILSAGYNLFSQGRYHKLFDSLQGMNYTNYKLLWIDDNSPDNSAYNLYSYLKNKNSKVKNKVKIIRNLQHLGIMANIHIYIKKYCGADDIVIICDADDSIIGIQTFQALNSIFKNPNYWYVHTRFLMKVDRKKKNLFVVGRSSKKLEFPVQQYRTKINVWVTSHMRIFRKKVMDKVPIQHFIQYKYSEQQKLAWPIYHTSSADRFQVYSNLQLCGDKRIHFIKDVFYKYDTQTPDSCYRHKEMYQEFKSKLKIKLKPLENLQSEAEFYESQEANPIILSLLKKYYELYKECKKK